MEWIHRTSSFTYSGNPVTRNKYYCNTPLGQFRVFEAVGGSVFYKHPFMKVDSADPTNEITPTLQIRCDSIENGKAKCEEIWEKTKEKINKY